MLLFIGLDFKGLILGANLHLFFLPQQKKFQHLLKSRRPPHLNVCGAAAMPRPHTAIPNFKILLFNHHHSACRQRAHLHHVDTASQPLHADAAAGDVVDANLHALDTGNADVSAHAPHIDVATAVQIRNAHFDFKVGHIGGISDNLTPDAMPSYSIHYQAKAKCSLPQSRILAKFQ